MLLSIIVVIVVLLVLLFVTQIYSWPSSRSCKLMSRIPGYSQFKSFLLNCYSLTLTPKDLKPLLDSIYNENPDICRTWFLGIPFVHINTPEYVEVVLKSVQHITKGFEYTMLQPWLREGLLTSTGSKWHNTRKMLTPAFHFRILEYSLPIFNKNVEQLVNILMQKDGEVIKVEDYFPLCTLDIVSEAAMGVQLGAKFHNSASMEYVHAVGRLSSLIVTRMSHFFKLHDWTYGLTSDGREWNKLLKILHGFTEKVIKESQKKRLLAKNTESIDNKPTAFVDFLLEMAEQEPESFSNIEIREEVDTFMFEGYETTSISISWTLLLLGLDQDIQEKAYKELQEIFEDSDRHATKQDLSQMVYLEAIIKESLRLYPPVSYMSRRLDREVQLGEYTVPSGTNILVLPYRLHRISSLYPDPERFNPERFLSSDVQKRHPFMYIPFSGGPRNCIGQRFAMMELKVILSHVIRHFRVEAVTKREDVTILLAPLFRPVDGIFVKLYRRM